MSDAAATPAPARRSGSDKRQRERVMGFRASPAEQALIKASAERLGTSTSGYIRSVSLAAPTTRAVRRPTVERAALAQMLGQLGKCGSNLNQVARALNSGQEPPQDIAEAVRAVTRTADAIWQALGYQPRKRSP